MNFKIIIAEDEDITRKHLLKALTREGYEAVGTKNGREALARIESEHFDVLITDIKMPEMNGMELLQKVREKHYGTEVLVITGFGSIDSAVEAMKKGAYEYITKPFNLDELMIKVKNILERTALKRQNAALKTFFEMKKGISIVARSGIMKKIVAIVEDIRDSDCNVLLTGETGVGKCLVAKIIHATSRRQNMPFLSARCAAVSPDILAEELFGQEKDGREEAKQGLLEIASTGTLFLDEIVEMPPQIQAKFFRVMENGEIIRTGGTSSIKADVRFIASAKRSLNITAAEGKFLPELHCRFNGLEIFIPPLRDRKEDIEPLASFFLKKNLQKTTKDITGFAAESIEILNHYSFPGNVRELENIVERAVILEKGTLITPESLPRSLKLFRIETYPPDGVRTIGEITRDYAEMVLHLTDDDKQKTASLLGISEIALWKILKDKK